jgi:hypothetical protein
MMMRLVDDAQSREAPADQLGTDVEDALTATCADEEEYPPTAEENVEFTDLDVASLCLLQLCDNSGTHCGLYNNILAFLHRLVKKKVDITKAKGRASFIATMQAKVKCPRPASKKVRGQDVVYFPFINLVRDLLRSNVFYDSSKTMELLALDDMLKDLVISPVKSKAESSADDAVINEMTTKMKLRRSFPPRSVQLNVAAESEEKLVRYQHSLDLEGCVPKHRRKKPKASGIRYTGAVLSDANRFCSFVELMLCYHAWCHKSDELPHGDSRLVCLYRLDFDQSSGEPKLYSLPFEAIIKCIVAFESEQYQQLLVLQVRNGAQQKLHTAMTI